MRVSCIWRWKSHALEVAQQILEDHLYEVVRQLVQRVTIQFEGVFIDLKLNEILGTTDDGTHTLMINTRIKRCGRTMRLLIQGAQSSGIPDRNLIAHLSKGHRWLNLLTSGKFKSVKEISEQEAFVSLYHPGDRARSAGARHPSIDPCWYSAPRAKSSCTEEATPPARQLAGAKKTSGYVSWPLFGQSGRWADQVTPCYRPQAEAT